ncbi:hypothetical protein GmRootV118_17670 [Variovorax sp. V118]|uniref:hypothetical protein n=1 Tax=Variovorax sp. V118 TaxID=3065954 RepID=UPI0034E85980
MTDGELRWWLTTIVVLLVVNMVRAFFPAYLGKKGQNLADKEDIAAITREIEQVRSQYALVVERFKAGNQLRFAALDRRLQAHQEAYEHWRHLLRMAPQGRGDRDAFRIVSTECSIFWEKNCLYLEPEAREAFDKAHSAAVQHNFLVDSARPDAADRLIQTSDEMRQCGEVLIRTVQLPGLLDLDTRPVEESKNPL